MSQFLECDYTVEGKGPHLFLIHGIGAARDAWRYVLPELHEDFTCITFDLLGHGTSPVPDKELSLEDLVSDLEALRKRLGIEKAHFAGHSLGGMIGPAYARKYPERVLTLGLLSTAAGRTIEDLAKLKAVEEQLLNSGISATLPTLVSRWFTDEFIEQNKNLVQRRLDQIIHTNPRVFLNVFRIYASTEMANWLKEITAPSLVLTGENDGGCNPRLNRFIAKELPNSKLIILDGLKHSILLEAPRQVAAHIKRFMKIGPT